MKAKTHRRAYDPSQWQAEHKGHSITLSDLQYTMALAFEQYGSRVIPREFLDQFKGGTLISFYARGYIVPNSPTTVRWTREGSEALKNHAQAPVYRKPSGRFSSWLSLATYDEKPKAEEKVQANEDSLKHR